MQLPILTGISNKSKPRIVAFSGLNRLSIIGDEEISGGQNLSFRNSPCVSNRPPRETAYTLTTPKAMGQAGQSLCWVDGTDFKVGNVTKGTVTAGAKCFTDLNQKVLILPDKKTYDYLTNTFATLGSGTYPAAGSVPDITLACSHNNRVFGVKASSIYACKLGDLTNWTTFLDAEGNSFSQAAYAIDWDTEGGDFSAIVSYQNHVTIFKPDFMYELYNVNPPYNIQRVNKVGCLNNKAHKEVAQVLYFVGRRGVYAYSGGVPRLISEKLNKTYTDAVLGSDGRMLYCSLYDGTAWELMVYDTNTGRWIPEDDLHAIDFVTLGTTCYALSSTGKLYKFNSGTETGISAILETKEYTVDVFNKKGVGRVRARIDLEPGSIVSAFLSVDGGPYAQIGNAFTSSGQQAFEVNTKIRMTDRFKLKFEFTGDFTLYETQFEYFTGEAG